MFKRPFKNRNKLFDLVVRIVSAFIILIFIHISMINADEESVIVIQSQNIEAYNQVTKGFKNGCKKNNISIDKIYNLKGFPDEGKETVSNIAKKDNPPDLIFTIGILAASLAKEHFPKTPIIFSMVINYERFNLIGPYISGIAAEFTIEKQFHTLTGILGDKLKIGVIYDPRMTGHIVSSALDYLRNSNSAIITEKIFSPAEISRAFETLKKKQISALWLLPDSTIINNESLNTIFNIARDNNIPVFCTSDSLVKYGALFSTSADYLSTGLQAAEMANSILNNSTDNTSLGIVYPHDVNITINKKLAELYGVDIRQLQLRKDIKWYSDN